MFLGILPPDAFWFAVVSVGLLLTLVVMDTFDLPKELTVSQVTPFSISPLVALPATPPAPVPSLLAEIIAQLVEVDHAHADHRAKAEAAARAKAEAQASHAAATAKMETLKQRLAAAYPLPQAPAPAATPQP